MSPSHADDIGWKAIDRSSPAHSGYYRVTDRQGRRGIAFMHANRTWTDIDGGVRKPFDQWALIR